MPAASLSNEVTEIKIYVLINIPLLKLKHIVFVFIWSPCADPEGGPLENDKKYRVS